MSLVVERIGPNRIKVWTGGDKRHHMDRLYYVCFYEHHLMGSADYQSLMRKLKRARYTANITDAELMMLIESVRSYGNHVNGRYYADEAKLALRLFDPTFMIADSYGRNPFTYLNLWEGENTWTAPAWVMQR